MTKIECKVAEKKKVDSTLLIKEWLIMGKNFENNPPDGTFH